MNEMKQNFRKMLTATGMADGLAAPIFAQEQERNFPEPERNTYVIEKFEFETGEVLPEMNVSYLTIGDPD